MNTKQLMKRKLINKREDKISWLQIIGFSLMVLGIVYLLVNLFWFDVNSKDIAINFFIIMLGFSFAFPDLLKDENKGLSTMRLVVFMIVMVISILLLKIGWNSKSLEEIGMDQYWMGVIAFVFGAKAVQYFFESRLAVPTETSRSFNSAESLNGSTLIKTKFSSLTEDERDKIAEAAIKENYDIWKAQYPNIIGCDVDNKTIENESIAQKAIVFFVSKKIDHYEIRTSETIPKQIVYGGIWIPTDVVEQGIAVAHAKIQFPGDNFQPSRIGTNVSRHISDEFGTVGLKVKKDFTDGRPTEYFLLSCFHVLYSDRIDESILVSGREIAVKTTVENDQTKVIIPGSFCCKELTPPRIIKLICFIKEGIISSVMDAALAKISNEVDLENQTFFFDSLTTQKVTGQLSIGDIHKGMVVYGYGCVSGRREGILRWLELHGHKILLG